MLPVPAFDQLHVISDLHMGGRSGSQIFSTGKTLAAFIDSLTDGEAKKEIALCINGDFVDFLAEPGARYFDPLGATTKLADIARDQSFSGVWAALERFVARPKRQLVLVLGNHDIELALPWVERQLLDLLSGGDAAVRGRITCSFTGEGFRAEVGRASILCLHGNELDAFNRTDHEKLRRIARDLEFGREVEDWVPNAGTMLVIDVMNEIKARYPFVDVLKPEPAVIALLWALDQATAPRLGRALAVGGRLSWDALRKATGLLSAREAVATLPDDPADRRQLEASSLSRLLVETFGGSGASESLALQLLDEAEESLNREIEPLALLATSGNETLGAPGAIWSWLIGRPKEEQVWQALRSLESDPSFDPAHYDATAERVDSLVGPELDFVVAGHTHKARALRRRRGAGLYYNSGTWAGLMRLSPEQLASPRSFKAVFDRLASGVRLSDLGELVEPRPTAVSFWQESGSTRSALREISLDGAALTLETLFES